MNTNSEAEKLGAAIGGSNNKSGSLSVESPVISKSPIVPSIKRVAKHYAPTLPNSINGDLSVRFIRPKSGITSGISLEEVGHRESIGVQDLVFLPLKSFADMIPNISEDRDREFSAKIDKDILTEFVSDSMIRFRTSLYDSIEKGISPGDALSMASEVLYEDIRIMGQEYAKLDAMLQGTPEERAWAAKAICKAWSEASENYRKEMGAVVSRLSLDTLQKKAAFTFKQSGKWGATAKQNMLEFADPQFAFGVIALAPTMPVVAIIAVLSVILPAVMMIVDEKRSEAMEKENQAISSAREREVVEVSSNIAAGESLVAMIMARRVHGEDPVITARDLPKMTEDAKGVKQATYESISRLYSKYGASNMSSTDPRFSQFCSDVKECGRQITEGIAENTLLQIREGISSGDVDARLTMDFSEADAMGLEGRDKDRLQAALDKIHQAWNEIETDIGSQDFDSLGATFSHIITSSEAWNRYGARYGNNWSDIGYLSGTSGAEASAITMQIVKTLANEEYGPDVLDSLCRFLPNETWDASHFGQRALLSLNEEKPDGYEIEEDFLKASIEASLFDGLKTAYEEVSSSAMTTKAWEAAQEAIDQINESGASDDSNGRKKETIDSLFNIIQDKTSTREQKKDAEEKLAIAFAAADQVIKNYDPATDSPIIALLRDQATEAHVRVTEYLEEAEKKILKKVPPERLKMEVAQFKDRIINRVASEKMLEANMDPQNNPIAFTELKNAMKSASFDVCISPAEAEIASSGNNLVEYATLLAEREKKKEGWLKKTGGSVEQFDREHPEPTLPFDIHKSFTYLNKKAREIGSENAQRTSVAKRKIPDINPGKMFIDVYSSKEYLHSGELETHGDFFGGVHFRFGKQDRNVDLDAQIAITDPFREIASIQLNENLLNSTSLTPSIKKALNTINTASTSTVSPDVDPIQIAQKFLEKLPESNYWMAKNFNDERGRLKGLADKTTRDGVLGRMVIVESALDVLPEGKEQAQNISPER